MKKPTLHDFPITYRWHGTDGWVQSGVKFEDIEKILGEKEYKAFMDFMFGQTYGQDGVYTCDLRAFLRGEKQWD